MTKDSIVIQGDARFTGQTLRSHGFGNPLLCHGRIKEKDTKIFLLAQSRFFLTEDVFNLTSGVLRVNTENLNRVYGAINGNEDVPYQARPPIQEAPCEKTYCSFGAVCLVDQHTREAYCKCQETCPAIFAPLCGSDGVTYSSECQLRMASCTQQKRITPRYKGACDVKDPCEVKECRFGSRCVPSMDGRAAECLCPEKCPTYGDHRGSTPACGSDGRDYPNLCELRRAACNHMTEITIRFPGKCDPCDGVECPPDQVCQLDEDRRPVCRCNGACSDEVNAICGSDGKTYANECLMRVESCRTRRTLRVVYRGECSAGANPCESVYCTAGQECDIDRYGIATCVCPPPCEQVMRPVCGSDGITYDSVCEMKRATCLQKRNLKVAHLGVCGIEGPCSGVRCQYGAVCVVKAGLPSCECPQCSSEFKPVCGDDGIGYANECKLRLEGCLRKKDIALSHHGLCDGCESVRCEHYSVCESDGPGKAHCVCPKSCVQIESPVCGSDGNTFTNDCELRVASCRQQTLISAVSKGPCDLCQNVHCKFGAKCEAGQCVCPLHCPDSYEPVCSKDGTTYTNECVLRKTACQTGEQVDIMFYGDCDDTSASTGNVTRIKSCSDSQHGCCSDGVQSALGPNHAGCPSTCKCNKLGSYADSCDPVTGQCNCKPGVGDLRCNRCEAGYWGLPRISDGNSGCTPCGCSLFGSVRDDCEQMTGRCVCKPGILGMKCNICPDGQILGPQGCQEEGASTIAPSSCTELTCYFGAECEEHNGHAECICDSRCPETNQEPVCGSDGHTYGSECQLKLFACRYQKDIVVRALGPCRIDSDSTDSPLRRSTVRRTTEEGSSGKSTRHLIGPSYTRPTSSTNQQQHEGEGNRVTEVKVKVPSTRKGGILGDICFRDKDCRVSYSRCHNGYCACRQGFSGNGDRTACMAGEFETPSFSGQSYLELRTLNAHTQITLEMEFKTFAHNGVLLYNGQSTDGTGDYLSLSVNQGFVEFRYNLGNGAVIIKSSHPVSLGTVHKIIAKRYHRDGILRLDNFEETTGKSMGILKSLDLNESLYLGQIPTKHKQVFDNIGVSQGLVGCIRQLRIGKREMIIKFPGSKDIIGGLGVGECENSPCSSMPCLHGSTCLPSDNRIYRCICPPSYTGRLCEHSLDPCNSNPCTHGSTCAVVPTTSGSTKTGFICKCPPGRKGDLCHELDLVPKDIPDFDGKGWLELPSLVGVSQSFAIEVWFLSRALHGLLLYTGQMATGRGDFLSLNLVKGHVQFRFDLGSGMANITSPEPISLGDWHAVRITRFNRMGTMQIDNYPIVRGESGPPLNELNVELPLSVGGYRHSYALNRDSGVLISLNGAIQRLVINGEVIEDIIPKSVASHGIGKYEGLPCSPQPCKNNGVCLAQLRDFECRCPTPYTGKICDDIMEQQDIDQAVLFDGKTKFKYANKIHWQQPGQTTNKFEVKFRTKQKDGLLLWTNKGHTLKGDFLAIAIVNGKPELSFNLGKQKSLLLIQSKTKVNDGHWHTLIVDRKKRMGSLQVDNDHPVTGLADPGATVLNTDGNLWLGGFPSLPMGLPAQYFVGFIGCVDRVLVDNEELHLVTHGDNKVRFCATNDHTIT